MWPRQARPTDLTAWRATPRQGPFHGSLGIAVHSDFMRTALTQVYAATALAAELGVK